MLLRKNLILLILIFFGLVYFVISLPFYSGDVKNHVVWGMSIISDGSLGFYEREFHDFSFPNYPPVSMFLFAASVWFYQIVEVLFKFLNTNYSFFPSQLIPLIEWENTRISFLKLPAIIPVIGMAYFIFLITKNLGSKFSLKYPYIPVLFFLLNPAVIYLAAVWGQNDFLQYFFIIGSFYYLTRKKLWLAYIFAALAILSKQTVLVLWACFILSVFKREGWLESVKALITSIVILFISYLPFHDFSLTWPFWFYKETLFNTTGFLASDNAINLWGLVFNFKEVDAAQKLFLFTWEKWGFVIFLILGIPLMVKFYFSRFTNERLYNFLFLISICYFFVLARMHERYLIPGVILAVLLTIFDRKKYWLNLLFFSGLQFLNLYRGLYQPDIPVLVGWLRSNLFLDFLALLYLMILAYNYITFVIDKKD